MGLEWIKASQFFGSILYALIGVVVFFNRRAREREGVPEERLRQAKAEGRPETQAGTH